MRADENLAFERGESLRLIIVVTKLIRSPHAAKRVFLLNP
jgi:hypothetical protein